MNLTDNEREKFLERCVNDDHCGDCPLEYLSDECMEYRSNLLSLALDLINRKQAVNKLQAKQIVKLKIKVERQKADIDFYKERANKYEAQVEVLKEQTQKQKAEIERLRKILENRGEICKSCDEKYTEKIKRAKAEAVKEFAERLIHEIVNRPSEIQSTSVEYLHGSAYRQNEIVDLVKEMVGETE